MFNLLRRSVYLIIFLGMFLIAQIFILTSQTALTFATTAITGMAGRLGYTQLLDNGAIGLDKRNKALEAKNKSLLKQRMNNRMKVRSLTSKVAKRTTRNVSASVASSFGEAVPYAGVGFVVAALAMDVMDGCSTMNDMNKLMLTFTDQEDKKQSEENSVLNRQVQEVCATQIPSTEGIIEATETSIKVAGESLSAGLSEAKEGWDKMTYSVGETTYGVADSLSRKVSSWKEKLME